MKEIHDLLKKNNLRATSYIKNGKAITIESADQKYIIKPKFNREILNYLDIRGFDYYPTIINDDNDDYYIYEYVDDIDEPFEQKLNDMIELVSLLHNKTTYYKEVDNVYDKKIYEDIKNNLRYLDSYYTDLISIIETKVFMSPSEYLLARNISLIYNKICELDIRIDDWYTLVQNEKRTRQVVLHNNLDLNHYRKNKLISWDKAKIDMPIFDIYKLYKKNINYPFAILLERYEQNYPLKDYEKELLYILISLPDIIEFNTNEYNMTLKINHMLDLLQEEYSKKKEQEQKPED